MINLKISGRRTLNDEFFYPIAQNVFNTLGLRGEIFVELDFVGEKKIKQINRDFRGIDKKTDVLSFPFLDLTPLDYPCFDADEFMAETNEDGQVGLGSVVICSAVAKSQASQYGHSQQREFAYLFVHGLLHLLGFDHMNESDKSLMRKWEELSLEGIVL